jgi:hypothetical protein
LIPHVLDFVVIHLYIFTGHIYWLDSKRVKYYLGL